MRILKADVIERYDACRSKLASFKAEWPKGMPVTRKSLDRAHELGIGIVDWEWFLSESLSESFFNMYCTDTCTLIGHLLRGELRPMEYVAIKLEWVYHYLLGIKKAQLHAGMPD